MQTGNIYLQNIKKDYKIVCVMAKNFLSPTANFEDILNIGSNKIDKFVLKNNESTLRKVFTFFQNDNKLLILNGFAGTGKKQISEHILSYIDKDTIICRFVGTESSTLDDVHLTFLNILKQKTSAKDLADVDTINTVQDKLEYIFSTLDLKFILVYYNFDLISEDNRAGILDYIKSFSQNKNIKSVITSRVFDTEALPAEYKYTKIMIKALSKEIFEEYLREYHLKVTPSMIEQLYRLTRGYFLYTCLSAKIMVNLELTINNFIIQYSNAGMGFDEFLAKTYYTLIVGTTKSAFNLFVKLRHGLNAEVLQQIGSFPDIVLKTLSDNFYIYKQIGLYFPTTFLKQHLSQTAREEVSKEKLAKFYEGQLELPVEKRSFIISRSTMQSEIAYYKDTPIEPEKAPQKTETVEAPKTEQNHDYSNLTAEELYSKATQGFKEYNYIETLEMLSEILSSKPEIKKTDKLYDIYSLLAQTYTKLSKWKYALFYYDILEQHYKTTDDKKNLDDIRYKIAYINYESYQTMNAIKLLKELSANTKTPQILADCNILLGNIALSASNKEIALSYYKNGISYIDENTSSQTAIELFFKYAILSDEAGNMEEAIKFYQRCIDMKNIKSKYTALAYSNLGDLFYDNDLVVEAKDCFEKAYQTDKNNANYFGMYYSLVKLSELTDREEKDARLKMLLDAKNSAIQSKDIHAIIDSTIRLGDLYYDYSKPNSALSEYLTLYRAGKNSFSEYNLNKLKSRLNDIRAMIGKEKFKELAPDYE
jgi:tetratricopeptide (TPR) repeat protein